MSENVVRLCNRDASLVALVDEIDHDWARQWTWSYSVTQREVWHKEKFYAKRSVRLSGNRFTIEFLHVKIIKERMRIEPLTLKHTIADHINGDSLDCRRSNLRWATAALNRRNVIAPTLTACAGISPEALWRAPQQRLVLHT